MKRATQHRNDNGNVQSGYIERRPVTHARTQIRSVPYDTPPWGWGTCAPQYLERGGAPALDGFGPSCRHLLELNTSPGPNEDSVVSLHTNVVTLPKMVECLSQFLLYNTHRRNEAITGVHTPSRWRRLPVVRCNTHTCFQ